MTEMEKSLAAIVEASAQVKQQEPLPFQSKRPQTLAEQVQQMERIQRQIADRLRRETTEARCEVERKITEAHANHARAIAEETARIDRERDEMIRQASAEYHIKIHDLSGMLRRHPLV